VSSAKSGDDAQKIGSGAGVVEFRGLAPPEGRHHLIRVRVETYRWVSFREEGR
jgi:hypothetical protein